MSTSVGTLFGANEQELPVVRKIEILPLGTPTTYPTGTEFTIPGGYKWTDFEKVELYFGWETYGNGQSMQSVIVSKEQIYLNPTAWLGRSHVDINEWGQVRATSLTTGSIQSKAGQTSPEDCTVLGVIGYLKEDITIGENKTLLVPETAIASNTVFSPSASWIDFDTVEITVTAIHTNTIRHTFCRVIEPKTAKVADRVLIVSYNNTAADLLVIWFDLTSESSWRVSVLTNGGNWSDIKISSIKGVKLGPQIVERFVGRPNDNEFINGNMRVWQETNGAVTSVVWGNYINDGWYAAGNGVKSVWKHVDTRKDWLAIAGGGDDSYKLIGQRKKAEDCLILFDTDGYLTVSFLYGSKPEDTNTHLSCQIKGSTVLEDFSPGNLIDIAGMDQPLIKDDQPHLATFTFKLDLEDPKFLNGLDIRIGTYNKTTPALANPSTANLALTDCKLEWGKHHTKCVPENKALELQRCQRFLEFMHFTAVGNGSNSSYLGAAVSLNYRVTKAKIPTGTITLLNGSVPCGIHGNTINEETVRITPLSQMGSIGHITGIIKLDARL